MICDRKNTVLFGSVIYKNVLQYFDEFIDCIKMQTFDEFGVLLLLDGIYEEEIDQRIFSIKDRCKIIECKEYFNPQQLRVKLIQEAKKLSVDILVIGDADDLFSNNRVEGVTNVFKIYPSADFVYNELLFFDGNRVMPKLPGQLNDIRVIAEKNFLGMSNTAIRISSLPDDFIESLFECNSFVFDWYLYSRLLLAGHVGVEAKNVYTLYRIYEGNCVGWPNPTEENLKKEMKIKRQHYKQLKKADPIFGRLYDCYDKGIVERVKSERSGYYWWNFTKAMES